MRVFIGGSSTITDTALLEQNLKNSVPDLDSVEAIVCGDERGVDSSAIEIARKYCIPVEINRSTRNGFLGKPDGIARNKKLLSSCDVAIVIWDGQSKGTVNLISLAAKMKLKLFVYTIWKK